MRDWVLYGISVGVGRVQRVGIAFGLGQHKVKWDYNKQIENELQ